MKLTVSTKVIISFYFVLSDRFFFSFWGLTRIIFECTVIYPVRSWLFDNQMFTYILLIITDGFRSKWPHCRRCKLIVFTHIYYYYYCLISSLSKLMHEIMVRPLPTGCRLTAIFDASSSSFFIIYYYRTHSLKQSCHSGTALGEQLTVLSTYAHQFIDVDWLIDLPYVVRLHYMFLFLLLSLYRS